MEIKNNIDKKTSFYCSIRDLIKLLMFVYKCGIQPILLNSVPSTTKNKHTNIFPFNQQITTP